MGYGFIKNLFGLDKADLPGEGPGWIKLKGNQGWRDRDGNIWTKDKGRHGGPHWDVKDRNGKRVKEVDMQGKQIWPDGNKNKNKKTK